MKYFLTGTAAEVIAVTTVDGRTIGLGQTGPHTNRLLEEFRKVSYRRWRENLRRK